MAEADPGIVGAVTDANYKTIAESAAASMAHIYTSMAQLASEGAAAASRRINMADAAMGAYLKNMNEMDPSEAISNVKALQSDLPSELAKLGSAIAQIQQTMKGAQTTPPPTTATGV